MNELIQAKTKLAEAVKKLKSIDINHYDHYLKIVNHNDFDNLDVINKLVTAAELQYILATAEEPTGLENVINSNLEEAKQAIIKGFAGTKSKELKELIKPVVDKAAKIKKLKTELDQATKVAKDLSDKIQALIDQPL